MNHTNDNSFTAEALRRAAQATQQQGIGGAQQGNSYLQQQAQQQVQSGQVLEQPQPQANHSLSISNEIKRLQQLHQLGSNQSSSNALLVNPGQSNDQTQAFLQSMFDAQQKITTPRFENLSTIPSVNSSSIATHPMQLPSNFFNDARLLMAQNQLQQQAMQLQQQQQQQQQQRLLANTAAELPLPSPHSLFHRDGSRRMRGGVIEPFPEKLHRLLTEVENAGRSDVISWAVHGHAFVIHKPDKFFKDIVPLYFRQSRLSSFKRQLNLYGFELINTGPSRGGYFHQDFVKGHPELCRRMRRVAIKVVNKSEKKKNTKDEDPSEEAATVEGDDGKDAVEKDVKTGTRKEGGLPGVDLAE